MEEGNAFNTFVRALGYTQCVHALNVNITFFVYKKITTVTF